MPNGNDVLKRYLDMVRKRQGLPPEKPKDPFLERIAEQAIKDDERLRPSTPPIPEYEWGYPEKFPFLDRFQEPLEEYEFAPPPRYAPGAKYPVPFEYEYAPPYEMKEAGSPFLVRSETGEQLKGLIKPDFSVWIEGIPQGELAPETGEFTAYTEKEIKQRLPFLERVKYEALPWLAGGLKGLEYALTPFAVIGQIILSPSIREESKAKIIPNYRELKADLEAGRITRPEYNAEIRKYNIPLLKEMMPGGLLYEEYRDKPLWLQLLAELPAWATLVGVSATALRASLASAAARRGLAGVLPTAARAALVPPAAVEAGVGIVLKYGIVIPITRGIPAGSRRLLQVALDQGLDRWIATQGRLNPEMRPIWQNWILNNRSWLIEKATNNMLKRQAERKGVQYAADRAASDTVREAETLLLQAGRAEVRPPVKPPTVPPRYALEKPFVREVPITPPPVTPTEAVLLPRTVEEVAVALDQATAEIEGLTAYLTSEPARVAINIIKKTGFYKGEIPNLTFKQYRDLTGKSPRPSILTPDKNHIRWEYALDDVATEMGYPSGDALREAIVATGEANTRLIALKDQQSRLIGEMREIEPLLPLKTLTEQVKEVYVGIGSDIKATQAALIGMRGEEAKIARATLKMLDQQLKYTETHLKTMADIEVVKPVIKQLRQKIHAVAAFKGLPKTQLDKIKKSATGKISLMQMTQPELETVLSQVRQARPVSIKGKKVITATTESKIQSLKQSLVADKYLTDNSFQRLAKRLGLTTSRYENQYRFITEDEGKSLIRAMNDEAEIGYTKLQATWQEGLDKNPKVVAEVEELHNRIVREGEVYFQGKPADVSVLKDMRFFTEDLEVRTGEAFYHIYSLMNRKHLDIRMALTKLKRRQIGSTPEFRKIIGSERALKRINDYIASKNKWMPVKSPPDITSEEIKLANTLEEVLFELQPDFRLSRFTNFYGLYKGNVDRIASEIPDAPKADIKVAVDIYESQGIGKLKAYLDTRTWGVIESGFEPHYVVNPRLAMKRLKTTFPTGRFKSREGVEFYPADLNIVQRVDRYSQQMLSFDLRPYVRELERLYQEAIPRLKHPGKVREGLSQTANEMMGYVERGGPLYNIIIKFAGQAYATVFGTMPILPFRNLFQNLAFFPDKSALVDPRNRALNAEDWEFYHTYVSQMESIPRDLMLSEEGALPILGRLNQLIYRLNIYGASDSKINRVHCFWASLNKAERALKVYKRDGDVRKFISASGLSGLTHTQQIDVLKTLTIDETKAIREIALEETNNVHFLYDRSQRAMIEMGGMGRIFGSLVIFPRSVLQRVFKQFKVLDPAGWAEPIKKKRAFKILLSMAMGSMAANYLFGKATGRTDAPYNPLNILRWSPGGLALGSVTALTDVVGTLFMALSGSAFALKELPAKMERAGDTMMPYYKLMMTTLESAFNLKYIDRLKLRELRSIIDRKLWEMGFLDKTEEQLYKPNREFYEAERSWEWRIKHAIFGTEPPPPDPLIKAVEDLTSAQAQLGKFGLAEDSDDGYTYEMADLASDIRKATYNLAPEDITAEKGFSELALMYKQAEALWDAHYYPLPASDRIPFRESPEGAYVEAYLFVWGKLSVLRNPDSPAIVQKLVGDYNIPDKAIPNLEAVIGFMDYYQQPEGKARISWRISFPETDARLFIAGKVTTLQTREAALIVERMREELGIPYSELKNPQAIAEALALEPEEEEIPAPPPLSPEVERYLERFKRQPELEREKEPVTKPDLNFAITFLEKARKSHEARPDVQQFDPELDKLWLGYYGEMLDALYSSREGKFAEAKLRRALELIDEDIRLNEEYAEFYRELPQEQREEGGIEVNKAYLADNYKVRDTIQKLLEVSTVEVPTVEQPALPPEVEDYLKRFKGQRGLEQEREQPALGTRQSEMEWYNIYVKGLGKMTEREFTAEITKRRIVGWGEEKEFDAPWGEKITLPRGGWMVTKERDIAKVEVWVDEEGNELDEPIIKDVEVWDFITPDGIKVMVSRDVESGKVSIVTYYPKYKQRKLPPIMPEEAKPEFIPPVPEHIPHWGTEPRPYLY